MRNPKTIAIIGNGAIARHLRAALPGSGIALGALLVRTERLKERPESDPIWISQPDDLPENVDLIVDCAGHAALQTFGAEILTKGRDLLTVSLGALADDALRERLENAAQDGASTLYQASGAIGALDALRAAATGRLDLVRYTGRKHPLGWAGSPAEEMLDLDDPPPHPVTHFAGNARDAALRYPKNANVAAAVALAGVGFDRTEVSLIADPDVTRNVHEITAEGAFGSFHFRIEGATLPDNPRSSALAAMSVVSALMDTRTRLRF